VRTLRRFLLGSRGSVAVGVCLFLPFLLILLFGIVEMGQAWYQKQMLVNATREGARLGSLLNDATNGSAQVSAEVTNFLNQSGFPGTPHVTVTGADGATGTSVTVTATANYTLPVLHNLIPSNLSTVTLRATTVMRHE
jgi:Flp pilus assembly protein TadG